jgi:YD repeat-containing protein
MARVIDARTIEVQRAEGTVVRYSNGISEYVLRDDTSTIRGASAPNELQFVDADRSRIRFVKATGTTYVPLQYFDHEGRLVRENTFVNGYLSQMKDLITDRALQFSFDSKRGKYTSLRDGFGRNYTLEYSGNGELAAIKGPGSTGLALSYEPSGNLIELRNLKTNQIKMFSYYSRGNVLKGSTNGTDILVFTYTDTSVTSVNSRTGITQTVSFSRISPSLTLATKRSKNGITTWIGQRNADGNVTEFTDAFNRKTSITYIPKTSLVAETSTPDGRWKYEYDQELRARKVTQRSPSGDLVRTRTIEWSGITPSFLAENDASGVPVCQISRQLSANSINDSISTSRTFGFTRQDSENRLTTFSGPGQMGRITFGAQGGITALTNDGVSCSVRQTVTPTGIDVVAVRAGLGLTASAKTDGATTLTMGDRSGAVFVTDSSTCSASPTGGSASGATNFSSAVGSVRTFKRSSWKRSDQKVKLESTGGVSK